MCPLSPHNKQGKCKALSVGYLDTQAHSYVDLLVETQLIYGESRPDSLKASFFIPMDLIRYPIPRILSS